MRLILNRRTTTPARMVALSHDGTGARRAGSGRRWRSHDVRRADHGRSHRAGLVHGVQVARRLPPRARRGLDRAPRHHRGLEPSGGPSSARSPTAPVTHRAVRAAPIWGAASAAISRLSAPSRSPRWQPPTQPRARRYPMKRAVVIPLIAAVALAGCSAAARPDWSYAPAPTSDVAASHARLPMDRMRRPHRRRPRDRRRGVRSRIQARRPVGVRGRDLPRDLQEHRNGAP